MRHLREQAVVGLCALAAVTGVGLVGPASSQAATHAKTHSKTKNILEVLGGSSKYVVYGDVPLKADRTRDYVNAGVHALNADGQDQNLVFPKIAHGGHRGFDGFDYSLVGSMLTAHRDSNNAANNVFWWNLDAGTSGVTALPASSQWHGSSPHGWVIIEGHQDTIAIESTSGAVTDYGHPIRGLIVESANPGPKGVVTEESSQTARERSFLPWANPKADVTLAHHKRGLFVNNDQCRLSAAQMACTIAGDVATDPGFDRAARIPLNGSKWTVYGKNTSGVAVLGKRTVIVHEHQNSPARGTFVSFVSPSGTSRTSKVLINNDLGYVAFGDVVVETPDRHHIIALASGTSRPRTLVSVPERAADGSTVIVGSK
jgi:hypothetical protein